MDTLFQFIICLLYKALIGWLDILLPYNFIPFGSFHKSLSGWNSHIRQILLSSALADQMKIECRKLQRETLLLQLQLNEFEMLNANLRIKCEELMEQLKAAQEMTEDEKTTGKYDVNKLVEKIEKEKSRLTTSYAYFNGLSKAHKEREDEWNAKNTEMAIELITLRTNHELELKEKEDRYYCMLNAMIQQKDNECKARIDQLRRQYGKNVRR